MIQQTEEFTQNNNNLCLFYFFFSIKKQLFLYAWYS